MREQGIEETPPDTCKIYDFELAVLRKQALSRLALYGISEEDLEPRIVDEVEPASADNTISIQDKRLRKLYEGVGASMKSFFQHPQFSPPEHGDISF
jgi:hypothetical protein